MALSGVDPYIEGSRKDLLDAIARAGSSGEQQYKDAQAQIQAFRQQAIDNASKGFSGSAPLTAQLQEQSGTPFDRRLADSAAAQADFSGGLANMQARNENYLTNVGAAQGTLEALNKNKLTDEEYRLKTIQAQLDAKAQQDAADRAAKQQADAETMQMKREDHAASLAAAQAKVAAMASKPPTFDKLMGDTQALSDNGPVSPEITQAQVRSQSPITNDVLMEAQDRAAFNHTDPQVELAKIVGSAAYGLDQGTINSILTPSKTNSYAKATAPPPPPDQKFLTSVPGVDAKTAQTIMKDPVYTDAQNVAGTFLQAPVDSNGLVSEAGDYQGMTPWDAFSSYLRASIPANKTRTLDALIRYYQPIYSGLGLK